MYYKQNVHLEDEGIIEWFFFKSVPECEPGFLGKNCSYSCPIDYYGRLCRERCDCSPDKYCDNVRGCLCRNTSVNCTDESKAYKML